MLATALESWRWWAARLALFATATAGSLAPVLLRGGWPANHDQLTWRFRTLVYADHFAQGDLLPVWSSEDFFGLGTPLPFFYHKLFWTLSAPLYLASGSVKVSIVAALGIFLVYGSVGLYLGLRRLRTAPAAAALLAAAFPLQSYTVFDWLVRGAMAELSACAVLPWVIYSSIVALQERRLPWHLFANLALLAFAHSTLAFATGLLVLAAMLVSWLHLPAREKLREVGRTALAAAAFALFLAPWVVAYARLAQTYDISTAATAEYSPSERFRGVWETYSFSWHWPFEGFTVWGAQLSPETLAALLAALATLAFAVARRGRAPFREEPALAFLVAGVFACFLLQLPMAAPAYEAVPGLRFLQFPWRWLALQQVLALLLVGWALARLGAARGPRMAAAAAGLLLAVAGLGSRAYGPGPVDWYPASTLEAIPLPERDPGAPGIGEYLPHFRPRDETDREAGLSRKERHARAPFWAWREAASFAGDAAREHCRIDAAPRSRREPMELHFRIECPDPVTLIVRQHYSGLERVWIAEANDWRRVSAHRTPEDPRLRVELAPGQTDLRVELPTLWRALSR